MTQMIYLNLPVADVAKSTAFYEAIGFTKDVRFSDSTASAMQLSDAIVFMLMNRDSFANFSPKPLADPKTSAQILFCITRDSREAVDATVEAAAAAGGKADINEKDEYDFMYGRSFEDPDGHMFGVNYIDQTAATALHAQEVAQASA